MHRPLNWASTAAALTVATAVHAQVTFYVDDDAPPGGDGLSWYSAFNDLQDALDAARCQTHVEIRVADGNYVPDGGAQWPDDTFSVYGPEFGCSVLSDGIPPAAGDAVLLDADPPASYPLLSSISLSIRGGFAGLLCPDNPDLRDPNQFVSVLSGDHRGDDEPGGWRRSDNSLHVVRIYGGADDRTIRLESFTIRGGGNRWDSGAGAGIWMSAGSGAISINDCIIEDNIAVTGGAIFNADGIWNQINGCTIRGNTAVFGGAVYSPVRFKIDYSILEGNEATYGGAAYVVGHLFTTNCIYAENEAEEGGAIYSESTAGMIGGLFVRNRADWGSVLRCRENAGFLRCTIVENESPSVLNAFGAYLSFEGCVSDATSNSLLVSSGYSTVPYWVYISESIVAGGPDSIEPWHDWSVWTASFAVDPRFVDADGHDNNPATWQDNDYTPGPGSQAIDATNAHDECWRLSVDLRGRPREVDAFNYQDMGVPCSPGRNIVDMGAFEASADTPRLCQANWNADEYVDVNDVIAYLAEFDARTRGSDLNADNQWGFFDLQLFLSAFAAGCP